MNNCKKNNFQRWKWFHSSASVPLLPSRDYSIKSPWKCQRWSSVLDGTFLSFFFHRLTATGLYLRTHHDTDFWVLRQNCWHVSFLKKQHLILDRSISIINVQHLVNRDFCQAAIPILRNHSMLSSTGVSSFIYLFFWETSFHLIKKINQNGLQVHQRFVVEHPPYT